MRWGCRVVVAGWAERVATDGVETAGGAAGLGLQVGGCRLRVDRVGAAGWDSVQMRLGREKGETGGGEGANRRGGARKHCGQQATGAASCATYGVTCTLLTCAAESPTVCESCYCCC